MSVMCLVWRYRLVVSIILVIVLCDVYASDAQPIGKVYPRGNHWAVGHLMGKKSTDEQVRPEDPEGNAETSMTTLDQDQQLERYNKHLQLPLLHTLMRGRMAPRRSTLINYSSAEDVLLRALLMQDDNES
uniref:Gastrin-releasing peptide n=1 Tax=Sinocyclocheilus anshuiensis TaxID=1608454 RepID=A0A671M524_9TELE